MADGVIELACVGTDGVRAEFEVVRGGYLSSGKGINLPKVDLSIPSVTEKDLRDLDFAFRMDAEYVGMSFVRRAHEVRELRTRIDGRAWLVVKIEKSEALDELDGILEHSDAVMVARGDLGVELPFASVPLAQKRIIQAANGYGRPVITATQMLESMTENLMPTRAEASDIANAILDGTDALMLSGETAVGRYPARTCAGHDTHCRRDRRKRRARNRPPLPYGDRTGRAQGCLAKGARGRGLDGAVRARP